MSLEKYLTKLLPLVSFLPEALTLTHKELRYLKVVF